MSAPDPLPLHGGQLRSIAQSLGVKPEDLLDFSVNINPDGPPASVIAALREALMGPEVLTAYPELDGFRVRSAIAAAHGLDIEAIVVSNGFAALLEGALDRLGCRRCLLPVPAFAEYRRTLERCGVEVIAAPSQRIDFSYQADDLIAAARSARADSILLANPQNPTGALTSHTTLGAVLQALPDVCLLLDEAFIDYALEDSLTAQAPGVPNLIVFRSVTKFYAMPGLRIAYAVAPPQVACGIRDELAPWPVTTLAEHALEAALRDEAYQHRSRAINGTRREALRMALEMPGVHVHPSSSNFLLLQLTTNACDVREWLLRECRMHARTCANFEGLPGEYLRIAIRKEADNQRLIAAFQQCMKKFGEGL